MASGKAIRHSVNIVLLSDLNSSLNLNTILSWHFQQWLCVLMIYFTQLSTFNNPCRNKSFNFGCMTKFFPPPATEMTSLGNSNFHSSCKRRRTSSASVSSEIRMNYRKKKNKTMIRTSEHKISSIWSEFVEALQSYNCSHKNISDRPQKQSRGNLVNTDGQGEIPWCRPYLSGSTVKCHGQILYWRKC